MCQSSPRTLDLVRRLPAKPERIITEAEFWVHLEFRLCQEFSGLSDRRYRSFWCDGFDPHVYTLDGPCPRVTGTAWICNGEQQAQWEFALMLKQSSPSREVIDWASLLPADDTTRWMSFDENKRYIEIDPTAATLDYL